MTWAAVCDAWAVELVNTVEGLGTAVVHRYAPWSLENLYVENDETHLAIWPEQEAETAAPQTATPTADTALQQYVVTLWQSAPLAAARVVDDEVADRAWLDLNEAVRARFLVVANLRLGSTGEIGTTRYQASTFPTAAGLRVMVLGFQTETLLFHSP